MPGTASGQIEIAGDSDWFRAHFDAGQIYQIAVSSDQIRLGLILPNGAPFSPPIAYSNQITFIAPVSGDYWVSATSFSQPPIVYQITSTQVFDPDLPSIATTLTLDVGQTINGGGGAYRVDSDRWFSVQLQAGQSYFFQSSILTSTLYLNDANGNLISIGSDQYHFTPTASGTYYLGTHGFSNSFYSLSLAAVADDHGESAATAGTLAVGSPASGTWETGQDSDWYAINLNAGTSYNFALTTSDPAHAGSLTIYDAAGKVVSAIADGFVPESALFSPAVSGTYYVSAHTGSDYYNPRGNWTYTLTTTTVPGDLAGNALTAGVLTLGSTLNGSWDGRGDVDWYAVTLAAGQSYAFQLNSNVGSVQIALYDSAGNLVLGPQGGSSDTFSQLVDTVGTAGTYYIGVRADNLPPSLPAAYTLTGSAFVDDFANSPATTGTIVVGGTASGTFEVDGDRDWFTVQLNAGTSYALTSPSGMPEAIRDAQGNLLTEASFGDQLFSPVVSGTYYLEVLGNAGNYTAGISQVADDFREDMLSSGVVREQTNGTTGNDTFVSTSNYEAFFGLGGDDLFVASRGYDLYAGGAGIDTVSFSQFSAGVNVDLLLGGLFENGSLAIQISGVENIEGSNSADIILGNSVANTLLGGASNDTLTGGAGADILTGGAGNDTFKDTAAGLNGDTIADFSVGDQIVISDANIANFSCSLSGNTLTYTGGVLTLSSIPSGQIVARAGASGGVQLTVVQPVAHNDFNGDGISDVLWRDDSGRVTDWLGQPDGSFVGNGLSLDPGLQWHVAGTGDFNGDGRVDILWRDDSGRVTDWLGQANGSFIGNGLNLNPGLQWHVAGTGDFDGDGRSDVLWRDDSGRVTDWLGQADGSFVGNGLNLNPGTSWHAVGTGDFNGDGVSDVLWQNDDGRVTDWLGQANGSFVGNALNLNPGTSWHVVGTGDFNGDGRDDILWRNDDGTMRDWLAQSDGTFVGNAAHFSPNPGADWAVISIGDYNRDAIDDLLLQSNTSGQVIEWLGQSDGGFAPNAAVNLNPGTTWHAQDPFVHDPFA
jgi:hypothetical protein